MAANSAIEWTDTTWNPLAGCKEVIAGCESGPGRRHTEQDWIESLAEQCAGAGVAFFNKQMEIDGEVCGDLERFPERLRVREFPVQAAVGNLA